MKLLLTQDEQRRISRIVEALTQEDLTLYGFLSFFLEQSGRLLCSEYHGVIFLPNFFIPRNILIDNSPEEFNKAYLRDLIERDRVLQKVMENPEKRVFSREIPSEDNLFKEFLYDCNTIRPTGEYYYSPLQFRNSLIGMFGHTIPADRHFSERDYQILDLMTPLLITGFSTHTAYDKIRLITETSQLGDDSAFFFIHTDGFIEIPPSCDPAFIEKALRIKRDTKKGTIEELIRANATINSMLQSLNDSLNPLVSGSIINNEGIYTIRALNREGGAHHGCSLLSLVIIEKEKEVFQFEEIQERYSLTAREMDIVKCIVRGFTNKEISCEISITEGTVKRHISNIYAKVGCRSRTRLLLQLTSPQ